MKTLNSVIIEGNMVTDLNKTDGLTLPVKIAAR